MRLSVRRVGLASAARAGCVLGGFVSIVPSVALAAVVVAVLDRVHQALRQVEPITLNVLGQELLRVDLLESLRLQSIALTLDLWLASPRLTFAVLCCALLALAVAFWALSGFLAGAAYNMLARAGLGLSLDLQAESASSLPGEGPDRG